MLSRIRVIFDVTCFLLALYMGVKMIVRYREDANATEVAYKMYSQTHEDIHPTFSLCLELIVGGRHSYVYLFHRISCPTLFFRDFSET